MNSARNKIPSSLSQPGARLFWLAIILTGVGTGLGAVALTRVLEVVQRSVWGGDGTNILGVASKAPAIHHVFILIAAGLATALGQLILVKLTSGNGIDITTAIWFQAGRLPKLRTVGSAILSVILVGMGVSLGREGAPKQVGAVIANSLADKIQFSDEQRRLLVACGAGAGMAAAYGVPLGGALFALEVLRGMLALRLVLPALLTSLIATTVAWLVLPDSPTYFIPAYQSSPSVLTWALFAGPIAGLVSVYYVRVVGIADRIKPAGKMRYVLPVLAMTSLGIVSIQFPQILGNGRDLAQMAFTSKVTPLLLLALLFLKPAATVACVGSGTPGGLFTPSLTLGALLGGLLGHLWCLFWPGVSVGLFAVIGAGAVLAATTQGPISAVVLIMELTGRERSFVAPLILAVVLATLVSRTIEPRSIYDARLTDDEIRQRLKDREPSSN